MNVDLDIPVPTVISIELREMVGVCLLCAAWMCEVRNAENDGLLCRLVAREPDCAGDCAYLWFEDDMNIERFYHAYMARRRGQEQ